MLTQNQQTVYDWINNDLELPVYAEAYKGAIEQLNNKQSGFITFLSHAGRDLMNGLASDAIGIKREQVQYVNLVSDFQNDWENEWGGDEFHSADDVPEEHKIPHEICKKVKKLIEEHKAGRLRAEAKDSIFFTTFRVYTDNESILENRSKEWRNAKKYFEDNVHLRKTPFAIDADDEVTRHFQNLDNLLYDAATSKTIQLQLRNIHEILEETN